MPSSSRARAFPIVLAAATWSSIAACTALTDDDGPVALFEVPRAGSTGGGLDAFYALPFPNDLRRRPDGRPDLSAYPRLGTIVDLYADAIDQHLDGFGLNAAMHLRFSGAIEVRSLPGSAAASTSDDASVYLVDVDPDSPDRGRRVPILTKFDAAAGPFIAANTLAVLPYPGFPLAEGTTYALVVTDRVRGDGGRVRASPDFVVIAGELEPSEPELAAARTAYAPLWAWLDEAGGDDRSDVVSAAVFTTQHATGIMDALRRKVRALPAPVAREIVKSMGGDGYVAYDGVFDAPNFQQGTPPYGVGGDIVIDSDELPVVQRMEPIRMSFSVPPGAPPATGWPVVIYAHGTGGSYHSYLRDGTAARIAQQGLAMISIDQVLHGPRNPGGDPDLSFFNFQNPLAARDNAIQGAADDFSVVRLIEGFSFREAPGDGGRTLRFDPRRISFFGHSQGGLTGPPFVAYEPAVSGAVLSGAGGLLYYALLNKTEPIDIAGLVELILRDPTLDEFHPVLALLQTWVERADSINYAPLLVRRPVPGVKPRPIFQTEGFIDHYTPILTIEALATAIGGNQVGPLVQPIDGLALRARTALTAPVTGNLDGTTAVLLQYEAPAGEDGHFVVFDVPAAQAQAARFLATLADTGAATVVKP